MKNKTIEVQVSEKELDITFHYSNPEMVKALIATLPIRKGESVLDAGSGTNKVWYKLLDKPINKKFQCELEDGCNFYEWGVKVDWVIGNPPYHESWKFTEQSLKIAKKGVAWLLNNQALNSHFTPRRIQKLKEQGWYYSKITVVSDKRWFGRYYFLVLTREPNDFIGSITKTF